MGIFSDREKWVWGQDKDGNRVKVKSSAKGSKYAKPAFIILILVVIGVAVYEYSTWDGTWPEEVEEADE